MYKKNILKILIFFVLIFNFKLINLQASDVQYNLNLTNAQLEEIFQEGDIIFQETSSEQFLTIQLATGSKYTHCGLILKKDQQLYVFEAVGPVKYTKLKTWIEGGVGGHFVLTRLKNKKLLNNNSLAEIYKISKEFEGKDYDWLFKWSNDKIYCSELVWKLYQRAANIELVKLKTFHDYLLHSPEVQKTIKERYGSSLPADELVVAPSDILKSEFLEIVVSN